MVDRVAVANPTQHDLGMIIWKQQLDLDPVFQIELFVRDEAKTTFTDVFNTKWLADQPLLDLAIHHHNDDFYECENMGSIVVTNIRLLLQKDFKQSMAEQFFRIRH